MRFCLLFAIFIGFSVGVKAQQIEPILSPHNDLVAIGVVKDSCSKENLQALGVKIQSDLGEIITCHFPANLTAEVEKQFIYLETSHQKNAMMSMNYAALRQSKVDLVHQGSSNGLKTNYSGKDVVVGIVDLGFQNDHPTFFDTSGKVLRIKRYWDQEAETGTPPTGYSYGHECADSTSIVNQLDNTGSHGTHVAGTAAGSGFSSQDLKHKGIAYEADMVFVKILHTNDTIEPSAIGDYFIANPAVIDAYKYIIDYAKSVGKPAVINLSWGLHSGSHDGNSIFDKAVEELVKAPGNIIVGANGNSGTTEMHFRYDFNNNDTIRTIAYDRARGWRSTESVYVDIWGSPNTPFSMRAHLYDSNKNILLSTPYFNTNSDFRSSEKLQIGNDSFEYTVIIENSFVYNQKPNVLFYSKHGNPRKNYVVLELTSSQGRIDAWNSGDAYRWSSGGFTNEIGNVKFTEGFKKGDVTHTMIENGGTGKGTISVGAYISRDKWINFDGALTDNSGQYSAGDIAGFSSEGPTVDGRMKPDISAPGQGIVSAINNQVYNPIPRRNRETLMDSTFFNGEAQWWQMFSGTSMASPHVCGIIALMLEANPNLSSSQVLEILQSTALKDNFTGSSDNNKWGAGKVDALAAIKEAERLNSVQYLELSAVLFPNPAKNQVNIKSNRPIDSYQVFSTTGEMVASFNFDIGIKEFVMNTSDLSNGMYFIRMSNASSYKVIQLAISR